MAINTLALILVWSLLGILLIASLILAFVYGKHTIRDNPEKGIVFVKTGSHISKPIAATLTEMTSKGNSYKYNKSVVMLPTTYGEYYHRQKRLIFVSHNGQLIASPFGKDVLLSKSESESLIYELCASHVGSDGMRALKGHKTGNVLIIATVAFLIGVAAMFAFYNFQAVNQNQQVTTPSTENPQIIEVK